MSKNDKRSRFENAVNKIQEAALIAGTENSLPRELTYQQALSIHLRSRQLARESSRSNDAPSGRIADQIEYCYKQRAMRRDVTEAE